jgi:gamma-glutamylcyclotransferase (GGCT)/AIG2-like uncharacterized protein YtfP
MEKNYQLFVYGSLRSGFHHPAFEYISRHFLFVDNGKIKGVVYDIGAYPGAIKTADQSFIVGEVYVIRNEDEFDWAIAQLDDYEGVDAEEGETPLFRRALAEVFLDNGEKTNAWVYWFNSDVVGKPVITSGDTLQYYQEKNKV